MLKIIFSGNISPQLGNTLLPGLHVIIHHSAAFHASPWKMFFQQAGNFSRTVRNSLLIPILFTFLYFFPSHIISIISLFLLSLIFFGSIFYSWKASWAYGSKKNNKLNFRWASIVYNMLHIFLLTSSLNIQGTKNLEQERTFLSWKLAHSFPLDVSNI